MHTHNIHIVLSCLSVSTLVKGGAQKELLNATTSGKSITLTSHSHTLNIGILVGRLYGPCTSSNRKVLDDASLPRVRGSTEHIAGNSVKRFQAARKWE